MSKEEELLIFAQGFDSLNALKNNYARFWSDISSHFKDIDPNFKGFLKDYFRAQLRIAQGKNKKAAKIMAGLVKRPGYLKFEEENKDLLSAIDLSVRGETRWWEVEPGWDVGKTELITIRGETKRVRVKD